MSIITLITDFGTGDCYVGAMKGVILQVTPNARIVDVTHEINAHDVVHGAHVLRQTINWFPRGTIHVAVVDPGVGTERRILAAQYDEQIVIAPDNGLLTLVHRDMHIRGLHYVENAAYFNSPVSRTFHGRDVLAPVAAHLAAGVPIDRLGPNARHIDLLKLAEPRRVDAVQIAGEVAYVDRFGNLVTNIGSELIGDIRRHTRNLNVRLGERSVGPLLHTYGDVPVGSPVALIGSSSMLEISVNRRRAVDELAAGTGTPVTVS